MSAPEVGTPPDAVAESYEKFRKAMELAFNPPQVAVGQTPHTTVYEEGRLKLYRYDTPKGQRTEGRPPVLCIYALINKPYIMDLQPGRSVVENLVNDGLDVFLTDWGTPNELDRNMTIDDYVNGIIDRCVDQVRAITGQDKINILGYCMGGTFSSMYAALHPEKVRALALMAAPLVATPTGSLLNVWAEADGFDAWKIARTYGLIPADFFNSAFSILDPWRTGYLKFHDLFLHMDDREFVENFLRMERWTNDGIPMAGPTYGEFVTNLYQRDMLVKGGWKLGGKEVRLSNLTMPIATIVGLKDNLVPPEMTSRVLEFVGSKDTTHFELPTGHIGLSVSRISQEELWPRVADWFLARNRGSTTRPAARRSGRKPTKRR
jgi:polyhydroxyalkanoate synthase subunit PhaC